MSHLSICYIKSLAISLYPMCDMVRRCLFYVVVIFLLSLESSNVPNLVNISIRTSSDEDGLIRKDLG